MTGKQAMLTKDQVGSNGQNAKKGVAKASGRKVVEIEAPDFRTLQVTLVGDTPLLCNRFGAKVRQEILDKQMHKPKMAKKAKDPQALFEASLYPLPGKRGKYGFPASAFKRAAVSACRHISGITMSEARGAFHVIGDLAAIDGSRPTMREDNVRLARGGVADIRFRGQFTSWKTTLTVRYNASKISPGQIINLLNVSGFAVGIGEWRPERNGTMGMFHVQVEGSR